MECIHYNKLSVCEIIKIAKKLDISPKIFDFVYDICWECGRCLVPVDEVNEELLLQRAKEIDVNNCGVVQVAFVTIDKRKHYKVM